MQELRPDGLPWGAGCGDAATDKYVPDSFFGLVSFVEACDNNTGHDYCYSKIGSDKSTCDDKLEKDMKLACSDKLTGLKMVLLPLCYTQASFYRFILKDLNLGQSAYDAAQLESKIMDGGYFDP